MAERRSRTVVLDASAGLRIVRAEPGSEEAARVVASAVRTCVPAFFWLEIVNVLARRHGWPGSAVIEAVHELESLGIETLEGDGAALLGVIDLVERHGLTAYDATYLGLALSLDAELATADRLMARAAGSRAILIGGDSGDSGDGGVAEDPSGYGLRTPRWTDWADAGAYLAQLRAR